MTLRQNKVKDNIRNIVAQFLERESNGTSLITVTGANVSKDLKKDHYIYFCFTRIRRRISFKFVKKKEKGCS